MHEIRIDGQVVDLTPNAQVTLDRTNPHFVYESLVTIKMGLPAMGFTKRNRQIFGHYELPLLGEFPQYRLEYYFGGQLLQEGFFILTEASERGYTGAFTDKSGLFFGDYSGQKLNEIDFDSVALTSPLSPVVSVSSQGAYCFPTVLNPDFYGTNGVSLGYAGRVNEYASGAYLGAPNVPMPFLRYFLAQLAQKTSTTIAGTLLTDPTWQQAIIYNTRALDGAMTIKLSKHLPEMGIEDYLVELRKLLGLTFDFNTVEKKLTIGFLEDLMSKPTKLDWSRKAVAGEIKRTELNRRLEFGYELDGGDQLMKDKPALLGNYTTPNPFSNSVGIAKLSTKISTVLVSDSTGTLTSRQVGQSEQFNQLTQRAAPRLAFWLGLQSGQPKATNTLNGQALYWTGPNGLAAKRYVRLEAMRKDVFYLEKDFILSQTDLATFDFSEKIHVNGTDYYVLNLQTTLPLTSPTKALLARA